MANEVNDLRSAIELLKEIPGQFMETDKPVPVDATVAGMYVKIGARGTIKRPTKLGPMLLCNNVEGFPGARIAIGVLADRNRIGYLLDQDPEKLGHFYIDAYKNPINPVVVPADKALCQEEVYLASDPDFDLWKILPAVKTTEKDGAQYVTMGLCYAHDPDDPTCGNATIHRMSIQGKDEMSVGFGGQRHIGAFKDKAFKRGEPLKMSVSIGIDPAIYLASCFEPPTTPLGFDELTIAGAMRGKPVELAKCRSIDEYAIAHAEYVLEGELIPDKMLMEDSTTGTGHAIPEFHGYESDARKQPVFKVKAVTCRHNPIFQMCIGASEEHVNMSGLPTEATMLIQLGNAFPGFVKNAYCPPSGGGKLNVVLQVHKKSPMDEGKQRQAAILALGVAPELKNVILVDDDVDIFDPYDVEWALTTRFKPEMDLDYIRQAKGHMGDPVGKQYYDPSLRANGLSTKAIYDATVPFALKEKYVRATYMDVDISDL